jgi:hypothetical protein
MKMKLLLFVGLITGSVGLSLLFGAPTFAAGESYKWINDTTIEATGGAYDSKIMISKSFGSGGGTATPIKKVTFVRDGNTNVFKSTSGDLFYTTSGSTVLGSGKCMLQLSLAATTLSNATLSVNDPIQQQCKDSTLTTAITGIGATDAGPDEKSITDAAKAAADKAAGATDGGEKAKVSTCKIDAIGWMLCPVMDLMSKIVDGAYGFVASLMEIAPITTDQSDSAKSMYAAWQIMRNFANVAFVIAFMAIIFSQMTSVGLSNYGIKKMLPRLIVAAILVNASYWICAIAVDISNILGASLNGMFKAGETAIPALNSESAAFTIGDGSTSAGWQGMVGAILVGGLVTGAILYVTLSALIPALLAALLTILTVFIVLTLRQALIILLIVVSPLAFVAYLLPNTESLFKKWYGLFKTLLLMYPIIAMIFGASALASAIVMASAGDSTYKVAIQIMGALISIIPLALTPIIMKTAGGVLGKVGGFVNNKNKGPIDGLRKKAGAFKDRRQAIAGFRRLDRAQRGLKAVDGLQSKVRGDGKSWVRRKASGAITSTTAAVMSAGKSAEISAALKDENAKKALADRQSSYVTDRIGSGGAGKDFAKAIAGPTGDIQKVNAAAVAAEKKAMAEAISNIQVSTDVAPGKAGLEEVARRFADAVENNRSEEARAMQNILLTSGSAGLDQYRKAMTGLENTLDSNSKIGTDLRQNMLQNHSGVKASANDLMQQAITGGKMSEVGRNPGTWSMSDIELVGQKPDSLKVAIQAGAISKEQAIRITGNEELAKNLDQGIRTALNEVAGAASSGGSTNPNTGRTGTPPGSGNATMSDGGIWISHNRR